MAEGSVMPGDAIRHIDALREDLRRAEQVVARCEAAHAAFENRCRPLTRLLSPSC